MTRKPKRKPEAPFKRGDLVEFTENYAEFKRGDGPFIVLKGGYGPDQLFYLHSYKRRPHGRPHGASDIAVYGFRLRKVGHIDSNPTD